MWKLWCQRRDRRQVLELVNRASRHQVTELRNLAAGTTNHVQVVEVAPLGGESVIIANVYDRQAGSENNRPAQRAR